MYDKSLLVTPDVVTCCEKPVMAMSMPDDRIAATLHSLCDAVQLDYSFSASSASHRSPNGCIGFLS